jgi:predicted ATPase
MAAAIYRLADHRERTNLPLQLTSFVGRTAEIGVVKELVIQERLVTLIGAGGIGKTRLALEVARKRLGSFGDGVWLVELAGLTDGELVPEAVINALGFTAQQGLAPTDSLIRVLEARDLLCVLDNCEHLVAPTAQLVDALLRHCPGLRILATSRDVLGVGGEITWRVPSMATPDDKRRHTLEDLRSFEAVQLLIQRARAARPGFDINDGNAAAVVRICQHADGIPLALELIASRTRAMSVAAIDERLVERFNIVAGASPASLPRQRTLQATFDWSVDTLSEAGQRVFRWLSVFAGGFTIEAAEAVCGLNADGVRESALDLLIDLVDKSLVVLQEGRGDAGRYRLLEPIRQYAHERLIEADENVAAHSRHARFFLELGEQAHAELRGARQPVWMARVEEELDNFRASFIWALEHDPVASLRLAVALERYWIRNSPAEGREWLRDALALYRTRDELRAHALYDATFWAWFRGDLGEARELGEQCLALARELGNDLLIGQALTALSSVLSAERFDGWLSTCLETFAGAEQHIRSAGDAEALGTLLNNYGSTLAEHGDLVAARAKIEEAVALARSRNDLWQLGGFFTSLAEVDLADGATASAEENWKQALDFSLQLGCGRVTAAYALAGLAQLAIDERPEQSLRLLGAATSLLETAGVVEYAGDVDGARRALRVLLGDEASDALWQEGTRMSLEEAVTLAHGDSPSASLPAATTNTFIREGEFWTLIYEGVVARLKDSKGLRDIARLLRSPGTEVAAIDLASGGSGGRGTRAAVTRNLDLGVEGDVGEALDGTARAEYRARLLDLEGEIDEADAHNDPERASRAREEREFLLGELRAAVGLGGRARRALDPAERARKAITGRIRDAVMHVEAAHPPAGHHLRRSIRTGSFCVYDPPDPPGWRLQGEQEAAQAR